MNRDQLERLNEKIQYYENLDNPIDFFSNYQLEDNIQENVLNTDLSQPELLWIFKNDETGKPAMDRTQDIFQAAQIRIANNSHIIIFIFGSTNSGKSEVGMSLAKYVKYQFKRILDKDITIHLAFDDTEVRRSFPTLQTGDLILRDESGEATGKGSRNLETQVRNVLRIFRADQNSCVFINPYIIRAPMIDYYIYVLGKNYEERVTRAILYHQYTNPLTLEKEIIPVGRIFIPLHKDELFRKEYNKRKNANIQRLKYAEGLIKEVPDTKKLRHDAMILVDQCQKFGKDTKKAMELLLLEYNDQFDPSTEGEERIGGNDHFNDLLYEKTKLYLEQPDLMRKESGQSSSKDEGREDPLVAQLKNYTFPYSDDDVWEIAKNECRFQNPERDFDIYYKTQLRKTKLIYKDVVEYYPNLSHASAVSYIIQKVRGLLNQVKGSAHEQAYGAHLKTVYESNENNKVVVDGSVGMPDAYVLLDEANELHVFSMKNLKLGESLGYLEIQEIEPELRYARENRFNHNKIRVFVPLVNNNTNTFHFFEIQDFSRIQPLKIT